MRTLCDHLNENLYFFVIAYEKVYMYTEIAHKVGPYTF